MTKTQPYMTTWLQEQIAQEVRDLELEAKKLILSGKITQGTQTVTQYKATLKRAARDIPNVTDMDLIVWFLHGLSDTLKHKCQCDHRGRTWRKFAELREHALAKEMESNSIRQTRVHQTTIERPAYMRKRYTRTDNEKQVRPDERHFERPHLVAIA